MNCSSMWNAGGRLALGLLAGSLLAACGTSDFLPPENAGEPSADAASASARTQQQFEEYWASQRQQKEAEPTQPAPEPVAAATNSAAPQTPARPTFSQWWEQRRKDKAETAEVAQAEPSQKVEPSAAEPEEKRRTFSQWWSDRKKPVEPEVAESAPAPQPEPAAEEPTKKNTLPIVTWWGNRKKGYQKGTQDVSGIDLSGNFPTASPIKDWDGYVRSPYSNGFVDVKGVPSGTLVADPRFDLSERKFFIVP